jgi:lipopolysaccharide biosynthesis glycosyltransferase
MKVFVGYDPREDIAYQVCKHSIEARSKDAEVIPLKQSDLRNSGWYTRPVDKLASTEFTFTRFLVPELSNFNGWAVFIDCDVILTTDIAELFAQADDRYAVMCVQHDYAPKEGTKMDGQKQTIYPRKNWSSVMLFNCGHPSNKKLNMDLVNETEINGAYLHRFSWLKDEEVGNISNEWNWLVGHYKEPTDGSPKLLHYTEGGPWFENYRNCEYHQLWKNELTEMMHG